jgi:glycosyltransferase involved in cell wall biosynthesis
MKEMKVIILSGGKFSSYDQASAAVEHSVLLKFIAGRFDRRDTRIPSSLVKSISMPAYIGYGWRRMPVLNRLVPYNFISDNLFDVLASRHIEPCDVFHGWNHYCLYSLRRARGLGARTIVHRGSAHPRTQRRILREEWSRFGLKYPSASSALVEKQEQEYAESDFVMVPSEFAYKSMVEEGVPVAKLLLLPYGVNLQAFQLQPKPDDKFRVFFAGMLSLQKGVYYLLEAWRQLDLPNAELILAGTLRPSFKKVFDQYAGEATYLGWVDYRHIHSEYARASVFVLPSLQEGSAKVIYEAMACARPVIVTPRCGSIARDGIDGFVIQPGDIKALKEKILYFYKNRDLAVQMGQAARERTLEFSTKRYGDELMKIYQRVLDGGDLSPWQPGI